MPEQQCHGGIIIDEIKLSESLSLDHYGNVYGLVDLGQFSSSIASTSLADHALVALFQPLTGKWHQVLGAFASRGNVKADVLAKIIVEAVIMLENSFLRVDFVTTDAAAWNRSMWRSFGISGKMHRVICKTVHPVHSRRHLHFISDFPHLIKNVRNCLLKHPFTTPEGTASINHIRAAWARDQQSSVTLKAMPRVHKAIVRPDGFEKMRVNYAFRLFSDEVRRGLFMYREEIQQRHGSATATEVFIKRFQDLISIMTSRFPAAALRANSKNAQRVSEFLDYLDEWERTSEKNEFISASTAEGLRVTLSGTLSLLEYVTSKLGFRYLMTSRLSHDILEQVFGTPMPSPLPSMVSAVAFKSSVVALESISVTMQQMIYVMGQLNNKVKENTLSSKDFERRIRQVQFGSHKRVDDEGSNPRIEEYRRINNTSDVSDTDNCEGRGMYVSNG
ncbi:hypothetical protein HPB49_002862 [Dermacentor silvarum]|uniref:Uncharacterized protein n=1 Tax=Dermacentor silvarum TaxID=543639 RepID=A0ACB8CJ78_DERSI|nr:hypothetical protein HPB49_002862 [Dermacentor silvarum]